MRVREIARDRAAWWLLSRPMTMQLATNSILLGLGAAVALGCGGSVAAGGPGPDAGNPEASALDSGGDGPAPSCPATYADVPQSFPGTGACAGTNSCSYYNQFTCFCDEGSGWECIQANCLCVSGEDGGCVNQACNTDADCPSGQHCGVNLGAPVRVCSVGCEGDASSCPAGAKCQMFAP
jgi:hypothetical protein